MEYFLKSGGEGRFFIPFFLTNDYNLRQLLNLFKVKGVVFDKTGELFVPFPDFITKDYFNDHNCNIELFFTDDVKRKRNLIMKKNLDDNFNVLEEQFKHLVKILTR